MAVSVHDGVKQFQALVEELDEPLKKTFQNVHQGYPKETLLRFLKARDMNVAKAHKMLVDCLNWRIQNEIDSILSKAIVPIDFYRSVRDSQLIGQSGYTKEGLPVIALGVGQSTYDKASANYYVQSHIQINEYRDRVILPYATKKYGRYIGTCVKILDMTGLKLSALSQIKLLTAISTVDDLNYPEKTDTYYIVNVPYIFSSCWKIVKPLLQERTRRKVQVLQGSGKDELLKIMDYASLPHFCKKEGSGSSRHSSNNTTNCFSLDYEFHQQLYNYIKQQSLRLQPIIRRGSFHVSVPEPDPEGVVIAETIESEFNLEDLCLDFSLPGYPDYTLTSNHNQQMVNMINLEEYVSFIVDATVRSGISRQVEALKSGFNQAGTIRKNGYIVIKGRPCKIITARTVGTLQ